MYDSENHICSGGKIGLVVHMTDVLGHQETSIIYIGYSLNRLHVLPKWHSPCFRKAGPISERNWVLELQ